MAEQWIEDLVKNAIDETIKELFPAQGHTFVKQTKNTPKPKDLLSIPLTGAALNRAKLLLSKRFDSGWESR